MTTVGQFPTGGALTRDGRFYWTLSTGRGKQDIRIVDVAHPQGRPDGAAARHVRRHRDGPAGARSPTSPASTTPTYADQKMPDGTPGKDGDVIHVYSYDSDGRARFVKVIPVPPQSGAPTPQSFPPTNTHEDRLARPARDLARRLDAARAAEPRRQRRDRRHRDAAASATSTRPLPLRRRDPADGKKRAGEQRDAGHRVGDRPRRAAKVAKTIQVGAHLSHPEAIALDTRAPPRVRRAGQHRPGRGDRHELASRSSRRSASRAPRASAPRRPRSPSAHGTALSSPSPAPTSLAVFGLRPAALRRPHPDRRVPERDVARHGASRLVWLSAKGLGTGPNPNGPDPQSPNDSDNAINSFQYLPLLNVGAVGIARVPERPADPRHADQPRQRRRSARRTPSPRRPARRCARTGRSSTSSTSCARTAPTTRSSATTRAATATRSSTLFGDQITPNAHALARRFPLLDHVYANSEASIDGHFWTSAGARLRLRPQGWFQNYGGRERPYDFGVYAVTWPANGFLFDQAERQGISLVQLRRGGRRDRRPVPRQGPHADDELRAGRSPSSRQVRPRAPNGCYPNDASIGKDAILSAAGPRVEVFDTSPPPGAPPGSESRFDCFKQRFTAQVATGTVPAFNYIVLPNDHTEGSTPGARTPRAMIAENDHGARRRSST